jgi:hypothetical protein
MKGQWAIIVLVVLASTVHSYWRSAFNGNISYIVDDLRDGTVALQLALHDEAPLAGLGALTRQDVRWLPSEAIPLARRPPEGRGVTHQVVGLGSFVRLLFLVYEDGGLFVRLLTELEETPPTPNDILFAAASYLDRTRLFSIRYVPRARGAPNQYDPSLSTVAFAPAPSLARRLVLPPPARLDSPRNGGVITLINRDETLLLLQPQAFVFATGGGNVSSLDFEATVLVGTTSDCRYESHIRATRSTGQMGMIATNGIRVPVTVTLHSHAVHADCSVYTTYRLSIAHPNLGSDDYVNTWEEPVAVPLRQREKDCNP